MIIISARKDFSDPDALSSSGHIIRDINLNNDVVNGNDIPLTTFVNNMAGKRILILVHGYNNEQDEVHDAYAIIEQNIHQYLNGDYDCIVGYSWPGGDRGLEWWSSKQRANAVARRFRFLLEQVSASASFVDVMSHSLGARVVLKALKQAQPQNVLRHYHCMAAAVDNEVLEKGEEFFQSVSKVDALYVYHSKRDGVLAGAYRLAELDNALGLYGPEDREYILNRAKNVFVANCKKRVSSHGGYKRSTAVYQYMKRSLTNKPNRFKTL